MAMALQNKSPLIPALRENQLDKILKNFEDVLKNTEDKVEGDQAQEQAQANLTLIEALKNLCMYGILRNRENSLPKNTEAGNVEKTEIEKEKKQYLDKAFAVFGITKEAFDKVKRSIGKGEKDIEEKADDTIEMKEVAIKQKELQEIVEIKQILKIKEAIELYKEITAEELKKFIAAFGRNKRIKAIERIAKVATGTTAGKLEAKKQKLEEEKKRLEEEKKKIEAEKQKLEEEKQKPEAETSTIEAKIQIIEKQIKKLDYEVSIQRIYERLETLVNNTRDLSRLIKNVGEVNPTKRNQEPAQPADKTSGSNDKVSTKTEAKIQLD